MLNERRKVLEKQEQENYKKQAYEDALQWKMFFDDHTKEVMFLSQVTGELRAGRALIFFY
jgi:hypothetical protein